MVRSLGRFTSTKSTMVDVSQDLVKVEGPKEKTSLVMFLRSFGAQEQVEGKVNVVK